MGSRCEKQLEHIRNSGRKVLLHRADAEKMENMEWKMVHFQKMPYERVKYEELEEQYLQMVKGLSYQG